jgi:hypothetical protein
MRNPERRATAKGQDLRFDSRSHRARRVAYRERNRNVDSPSPFSRIWSGASLGFAVLGGGEFRR